MKETIDGINMRSIFSMNLKRLRDRANYSQLTLAGESGLTHNFINDMENGKKWFSAESLAKLSKALKAEPHEFFMAHPRFNDRGAEIISIYLDDISGNLEKTINEYRARYLPDNYEKPANKKK